LFRFCRSHFPLKKSEFESGDVLKKMEGWDSFAHMLFVVNLEKAFNIQLTGDEIADLQTIGDIEQLVATRLGSEV